MLHNAIYVRYRWGIVVTFVGFLLIIAMVGCGSDQVQNGNEPEVTPVNCNNCAELRVTMDKYSYTQGEPITITAKVVVLNQAHLTAPYRANPNFQVNIADEQGQPIPLTEEGMAAQKGDMGFRMFISITRNHPFEETFRVDPWFELTKAGMYTLTVKKWAWDVYPEEIELVSNPIVFTLSP